MQIKNVHGRGLKGETSTFFVDFCRIKVRVKASLVKAVWGMEV
jgi:hypothetical protein